MTITAPTGSVADVLATTWMISSDSHIIEPPDLWDGRVPPSSATAGPASSPRPTATGGTSTAARRCRSSASRPATASSSDPDKLRTSAHVRRGAPGRVRPRRVPRRERDRRRLGLGDLPEPGPRAVLACPNTEVVTVRDARPTTTGSPSSAAARHARLKGIAMVNVDDPNEAVAELQRAVARSACAARMITVAPPTWRPFRSPRLRPRSGPPPQDLDMPLSLHTATDRGDPRVGDAAFAPRREARAAVGRSSTRTTRCARRSATSSSPACFERYPRSAGRRGRARAGVDPVLPRPDGLHVHRPPAARRVAPLRRSGVLPSDFFAATASRSFQEDAVGIRLRDVIGVDTLMWGSDYPHTESTFPRSQEILGEILGGVAPADARADRVDQRREPLSLRSAAAREDAR